MRTLLVILIIIFASHIAHAGVNDVQKSPYVQGKDAWLIEERSVPILSVRLVFSEVGAAHMVPEKRGLATLAVRLLTEGAGDLDSTAFHSALDRDAIEMGASVGQDNVIISLETLSEHKERAFELLSLALSKPRIDEASFERVKARMVTELTILQQRAGYMASRHFSDKAFGAHPYHAEARGTAETLKLLTIDDVRDYINASFTLANLNVSVVGDISKKELSSVLKRYVGLLSKGGEQRSKLTAAPWLGDGKTFHFDHPNAQTEIQFGWEGVKRDNSDFYAAYILNHMLGGSGLTSKLSLVIRGEHGLAYSVGTGLASYDKGGMLKGSFATRHDQAKKAVKLLKETTQKIAKKGFTEEELATAKRYLSGSFPLNLASNKSLVQYLLTMQLDDLGEDYLEKRNSYMNAVTLDDVNRLARTLLSPEKLLIVTTGN